MVKAIVDLTAEFPEPAGVRIGRHHRGPLRDGSLLDAAYQTRSAARGLIRFTIFNDVGAARRLHR